MPTFFFNIISQDGRDIDQIGLDFPDLGTACREARRSVVSIFCDLMRSGKNPLLYFFEICGISGHILTTVYFADVISKGSGRACSALQSDLSRIEGTRVLFTKLLGDKNALFANIQALKDMATLARQAYPDAGRWIP
ncbi:DUF6894 family protein [Methylobacterium sp. WSM2598]|uniref:DUF6894 family protein n=1 Tax=Methylobacterium sp. WSM2598 TaxID=398261 RepID=UPI0012F63E29|nr:hypothetical protein [Methylobacterium sp. WSM2598]